MKFKVDELEKKRDYLAWRLGCGWTNIAEVRPLNKREFSGLTAIQIELPEWASEKNTYLVRLVGDISSDELVKKDINAAAASELVFSLWVRRRDTHAANRAYVDGVPVFFDHQTGFLAEPELEDVDYFFSKGIKAGYGSKWRVELVGSERVITTKEQRRIGLERNVDHHSIADLSSFCDSIRATADFLKEQDSTIWLKAIRAACFERHESEEILAFLERNRHQIDADIEKMYEVIFTK